MIKNVLSVDLESFVHREFDLNKREIKDEGYTLKATKYLLELFDRYNTKTTFFVVGEIYDWYPKLIEEVKKRGHEIAYHTHQHLILNNANDLINELKRSKDFLNTYKPQGFRAPRISMKEDFFLILKEYGFTYDSSTYGTDIYKINNVKEIPVSLFPYLKSPEQQPLLNFRKSLAKGIPFGSGLLFPLGFKIIQSCIKKTNEQKRSAILFVHPWQFFSYKMTWQQILTQPHKALYRIKINKTFNDLLANNQFVPMRDL